MCNLCQSGIGRQIAKAAVAIVLEKRVSMPSGCYVQVHLAIVVGVRARGRDTHFSIQRDARGRINATVVDVVRRVLVCDD